MLAAIQSHNIQKQNLNVEAYSDRQMNDIIIQTGQIKKSRVLLRKKNNNIPFSSKCSYLFKHKDNQVLSEINLKQAEDPLKAFVRDVFCQKSIKSIIRNDQYICLKLKQSEKQRCSLLSHAHKFLSSSDKINQNFGSYLQCLDQNFQKINEKSSRKISQQRASAFQNQLQQILASKRSKKFICFYFQSSKKSLNLDKIFISCSLLRELGHNVKQFCEDFLKYKHLFIQLFDSQILQKLATQIGQNHLRIAQSIGQIQQEQNEKTKQANTVQLKFDDFVYRTIQNQKVLFEQKLKAKFIISKPKANITFIELESLDGRNVVSCNQKKLLKDQQSIKKESEKQMQFQMKCLEILDYKQFNTIRPLKCSQILKASN